MRILFGQIAVFLLAAVGAVGAAAPPRTFTLRADGLIKARAELVRGAAGLSAPLAQLRAEADQLLALKPASVMDKTSLAASGDRHDFFSLAPYWWPDPAKPDGLPYVQRDGEVNPASRRNTDRNPLIDTCSAVATLGLAFWFTGDERYARKAATLARVWFLDPATRMNPNLQHAQAIPGITDGRGIGLIEARGLVGLCDGLALLAGSAAWSEAEARALRAWFEDYYRWLITSKNGRDEAAAENNHGSWYDVQAAGLALTLGRTDEAKAILAAVPRQRIARQIEPDGSQPQELRRTRSLNYVLFNLEALVALARLGEHVGLDLWKFATADGRSLSAALRAVAPFADPSKPWIKRDLDAADRARILPLLAEALRQVEDARLREPFTRFAGTPLPAERWRLWIVTSP